MKYSRIQSPSSINTYRQCPRKYYYQYIAELETRPSIHLIRGKIAHSVLEDFFKVDIASIGDYRFDLKVILHDLLSRHWNESEQDLGCLGLTEREVRFYLDETKQMLQFWLIDFLQLLEQMAEKSGISAAFDELRPRTEEHYISEKLGVQGYIDAIFEVGSKIKIIDYKTSARKQLTEGYKLQLAIYAMLYFEKHGRLPDKVGIHFLRFDEITLDVDQELVDMAKKEVKEIHEKTLSREKNDYPRKTSPLCKWRTGQCDFYDCCQG